MTALKTDQAWYDELILGLRLRNVRGAAIGDALAEVRSHCADSGESPADAFGDPRAYADSLTFPADEVDASGWVRTLAPTSAGVLAFYLVPGVVRALRLGADVGISWGALAAGAMIVCGVVAMVRWIGSLVRSRLVFALACGAVVAACVVAPILWQGIAVSLPAWLVAVLIVILLVLSVWGTARRAAAPDLVVDPLSGPDARATQEDAQAQRSVRLVPWLMPMLCVVWAIAWLFLPLG